MHEITHALLGPGYGHGKEFIEKCKSISPNSDYATAKMNIPIRKYLFTCPDCGQNDSLNNDKDRYCGLCFDNDKKIVKFDVKENVIKANLW